MRAHCQCHVLVPQRHSTISPASRDQGPLMLQWPCNRLLKMSEHRQCCIFTLPVMWAWKLLLATTEELPLEGKHGSGTKCTAVWISPKWLSPCSTRLPRILYVRARLIQGSGTPGLWRISKLSNSFAHLGQDIFKHFAQAFAQPEINQNVLCSEDCSGIGGNIS